MRRDATHKRDGVRQHVRCAKTRHGRRRVRRAQLLKQARHATHRSLRVGLLFQACRGFFSPLCRFRVLGPTPHIWSRVAVAARARWQLHCYGADVCCSHNRMRMPCEACIWTCLRRPNSKPISTRSVTTHLVRLPAPTNIDAFCFQNAQTSDTNKNLMQSNNKFTIVGN